MRAARVAALALVSLLPAVHATAGEAKAPPPATIGWSDGARWGGAPYEIDEATYGVDFVGEDMPQIVVRIVGGVNRTVVLQSYDDLSDEWVTDDVQRSRHGVAKLTPNPYCEDQDGNEVWCAGVWRYRVRLAAEPPLPARSSRPAQVLYTPYESCYAWDGWLCEGGDW